jgi:hypothetical protein
MLGVTLYLISVLCACGRQPSGLESMPEPTEARQTAAAILTPVAITLVPAPAEGTPTPSLRIMPTLPVRIGEEVATPISPTIPIPSSLGLENLVRQAKADLARRLAITDDQVDLVELKAVVWPDASLGCPQPGMMYAQVLTPGYRVVLEAKGESYPYHTDKRQEMVYCKSKVARPFLSSESTETVKLATEDLARRLSIPTDSIAVVAVIGQEFSPNAFYCRGTKERIAREESPAVRLGESILLSAEGREYEYHASDQTVIFCRQLR